MTNVLLLLSDPAGAGCLALDLEELARARLKATEVLGTCGGSPAAKQGAQACSAENLLDATGMAAATGIPASWFAAAAQQRTVPFHKLGRYVRFRLSEVIACTRVRERIARGK